MTNAVTRQLIWVKRSESPLLSDAALRHRAGVDDESVKVETKPVGKWGVVAIPAGSRDEAGEVLPRMSVGYAELPPDGRLFLLATD